MALPLDHFFDQHNTERLRAADTMLVGRQDVRGLPGLLANDLTNPGNRGEPRDREDQLEDPEGRRRRPQPDDTGVWGDTTRIVRRAEAHAAITDLKAGPGRDIVVFGSGTMWNDLFAAGLVDELYVMVGPSIVPDGMPAFTQSAPANLRLVGTRTLAGSDNVLIHYATTPA